MILEHNFSKVEDYVWNRLNKELNPRLYYHNIRHTRDDVLPATRFLAEGEGIKGETLYLLLTGALFHDIGYIEQYENNEPIAARIAMEALPGFGYTPDQIETVTNIILSTRMPQKPKTLVEEVLCDADMDSLGQEDFFFLSNKLYNEYCYFSTFVPNNEWLQRQLIFLKDHTYFTNTARKLRNKGKRENIEKLRVIVSVNNGKVIRLAEPTVNHVHSLRNPWLFGRCNDAVR